MNDNMLLTALKNDLYSAIDGARERVVLCSPFLTDGVAEKLAAKVGDQVSWRLLTKLDAVSIARKVLGPDGLHRLLEAGVEIRSLSSLHAKVYLIDSAAGFIGSANLTHPGLGGYAGGQNLELTVRLTPEQVGQATGQLETWWDQALPVTAGTIESCRAAAKNMKTLLVPRDPDPVNDGLVAIAQQLLTEAEDAQFWVKAMFQDGDESIEWDDRSFVMSSKKGRPGFAVHDLLVIYTKQARRCNAVVEVTGDSYIDDDQQRRWGIPEKHIARWPWVTPVRHRLSVPIGDGIALGLFGATGNPLQNGHIRITIDDFAAALTALTGTSAQAGADR